jgi:dihydropyrimidinase
MRLDTIIRGGLVVTAEKTRRVDIGVRGQKIVVLGRGLARKAPQASVIDATDCYVIPGGIDAHVHLDLPVGGTVTADDFASGTRMAACGGVTTVLDFVTPAREEGLREALRARHAQAAGRACVDYGFHMSITNLERQASEMRAVVAAGIPTFKQYMVYDALRSSDGEIYQALERLRDLGGRLMVHAESPEVLAMLVERHHRPALMRRRGAALHALSRPNVVEAEAVSRCLHWARATGGPLYFVHLSAAESVAVVRAAQADGADVLAETCAHYLVLDDRVFAEPDGHLYATSPQVKKPRDRRRLWSGLADGTLGVVSTDTCSFTRAQKNGWGGDWTQIPMGVPGSETLLPIVYTLGVLRRRLTLNEFVAVCCENPARVMGLYPRKGTVQVGSDADLAVIHPTRRRTVDWRTLHSNCDWSPYLGRRLAGFPRDVLCRGVALVRDGAFVGPAGHGEYLKRSLKGT